MAGNHADRAHSVWSASSSAANFACPGRLRMIADLPPQPESEGAAWGTATHEVAEHCLRNGTDAVEMIGRFVVTKEHRIEVDEEVAETAQVYVDYVRAAVGPDDILGIEQRFNLNRLDPTFEAGGTADAVILSSISASIEVVDLKGGRGVVVEAKGNPQLRTYALGALLTFRGYDVQHVKVTIVQPRAGHRDGIIRSETFHVADLMEWAADLLEAMQMAREAWVEHEWVGLPACGEHSLTASQWSDRWLQPGSHCRWCPANGLCPALARKAEEEARLWFTDESGEQKRNTPDRLTPEEVARILDHADMIQDHLNAVRAYAQSQAEGGVRIPGYILVEKHGREAWLPDVEAKVRAACEFAELPAAKFQNEPRLKTPKQIRKALGPAYAKLVETLSATPTAGHSLVRQDKTTRPEVPSAVETHFDIID